MSAFGSIWQLQSNQLREPNESKEAAKATVAPSAPPLGAWVQHLFDGNATNFQTFVEWDENSKARLWVKHRLEVQVLFGQCNSWMLLKMCLWPSFGWNSACLWPNKDHGTSQDNAFICFVLQKVCLSLQQVYSRVTISFWTETLAQRWHNHIKPMLVTWDVWGAAGTWVTPLERWLKVILVSSSLKKKRALRWMLTKSPTVAR